MICIIKRSFFGFIIFLCLILISACYEPHFNKESDNDNVVRFVEVYITYENEPLYRGETYSFGYSEDYRLQSISYLNQQSQNSKWENMTISKDKNGNPIGFEGEITGDIEFAKYILSIFSQDYMHQLENNDQPLDIDLSRVKFAQDSPIELHCEYAYQIKKENILEIRLDSYYDVGTFAQEYKKTILKMKDHKSIHDIYTWTNSEWCYERSE